MADTLSCRLPLVHDSFSLLVLQIPADSHNSHVALLTTLASVTKPEREDRAIRKGRALRADMLTALRQGYWIQPTVFRVAWEVELWSILVMFSA